MGVGEAGCCLPCKSLEGMQAHSKLDCRIEDSLQALPLADKGHKGWVKALVEHCNHWHPLAEQHDFITRTAGERKTIAGCCNLSRSYQYPRMLQFQQ